MPGVFGHPSCGERTGKPVRICYLAFGWLCVALGAIGAVLPVMPTTIFLIAALWAFARGSKRYHDWLYSHPRFGPPLRRWTQHRVISPRAKLLACAMMSLSFAYLALATETPVWAQAAVAGCLVSVAAYLLSKPSRVPQQAEDAAETAVAVPSKASLSA